MINLISKNSKVTNAPDHPVYMMCIRVAYVHVCVVWYAFVCIQVLLILHVKCRYFFEERFFLSKSKQLSGMSFYTIVIYQSLLRYTYTGVCTYAYKCQGV